ncbi:hypothetical protein AAZX31_16G121200 [Glycine max]|uniref:DUF4408 domain-containing protein n=2 Tax=Glycine subgen. Soja TaxID=1462606 RepID=I1MNB8_SOYBN|nr:uncharacterized protein LOC102669125 [Glycine max]XP_028206576.1 uncharacterized protein LOC114390090 [Glycine soja]KAG4939257.1 hypothetical protein JHK86_045398 [Glycine max]KAG4941315.1 hypothetical protein JHK87_045186 [Glycine soja]KAG4952115.1 hypothetical protein JHK85_045982 [Glycine max]KAG5099933.1 hypothetical protein JHK82_044985 [Glycine max]KAG5108543.1 hypothetical protein JHK84_045450 [Glycine max]|eukprot:XP_006599362.1 uncharacterized protein LOC102669125 [Glycine max]
MDEFLLKAEKANAIRRHNNDIFAVFSKALRILELCLVLVLLSWILTRLPFALALSAEFLRRLIAFAASPLVVFAVSNAIIAALLAQSRRLSAPHSADSLYREFLHTRTAVTEPHAPPSPPPSPPPPEPEFHDKQVIVETVHDAPSAGAAAKYRRSQSEKIKVDAAGKLPRRKQLRRSETEKRGECLPEILYPQDELSNEEFQRAIEAFIAKQLRFLREESSAIVVQNPS